MYLKGTTTARFTTDGYIESRTDSCQIQTSSYGYSTIDSCEGKDCYVFEYWCDGNGEIIQCPNGCNNGACV